MDWCYNEYWTDYNQIENMLTFHYYSTLYRNHVDHEVSEHPDFTDGTNLAS